MSSKHKHGRVTKKQPHQRAARRRPRALSPAVVQAWLALQQAALRAKVEGE